MAKLPKSMQQKKNYSKNLRTKASQSAQSGQSMPKSLNRQMRRRMQQQGVEGLEEISATRVIIQTGEDNDIIIESPQVMKMSQQGMDVFQVIGAASEAPAGSIGDSSQYQETETSLGDVTLANEELDANEEIESLEVQITEDDINLVAMQAGVSKDVAEKALKAANGDLVQAIMNLKS